MGILITGATGFLGRQICKRISSSLPIYTLGRKGCDFIADLSNTIPDLGKIENVNCVIHTAGKAHSVSKTPKEIEEFWNVNLEGTKNLCWALQNAPKLPGSFIFISTVAVYGINYGVNIDERSPLSGTSDYARSKIAAEQWLTEWTNQNGIKLLILRLPIVAGPNPPGNLGIMINGIKSGNYFRIGSGKTRRSMVMASDVADIILESFGKEGIYNLTDGFHPSFRELEDLIVGQLGLRHLKSIPFALAKIAAGIGDIIGSKFPLNSEKLSKLTHTLTFNDDKAIRELNWKPGKVLKELKIF
jgi:nucleoside-diphosphate-sugar epimerase